MGARSGLNLPLGALTRRRVSCEGCWLILLAALSHACCALVVSAPRCLVVKSPTYRMKARDEPLLKAAMTKLDAALASYVPTKAS